MIAHRAPESKCWNCARDFDGMGDPELAHDPRAPKPGDVTLCHSCLAIHIVGEDMRPRLMTPEECVEFRADEKIQQQVAEMAFYLARGKRKKARKARYN